MTFSSSRSLQRGAVAIVVAGALLALMAVVGLLIDLGHVYVVKRELQNAADACALSAAKELMDMSEGVTSRAKAAGITAAHANKVNLQSESVTLDATLVTFSPTLDAPLPWGQAVDSNTVYVRCSPYEDAPFSISTWVGHIGEESNEVARVTAAAVARIVGTQPMCALPLAICASVEPSDLHKGVWYSGRLGSGTATTGMYDWVRLGGGGASNIGDIVAGKGVCSPIPDVADAQGGVAQGVAQAWNTRFGLYSGSYKDMSLYPPDRVGYAFTKDRYDSKGKILPGSWPSLITSPAPPLPAGAPYPRPANNSYQAVGGTHDADYVTRLGGNDSTLLPYDPRAILDDNAKAANLPGNPSPLDAALHAAVPKDRASRRLVMLPIIKCGDWQPNKKDIPVKDWGCVFLLHPINDANTDVEIEFRGLRSANDCGGTNPDDFGPPTPALVR